MTETEFEYVLEPAHRARLMQNGRDLYYRTHKDQLSTPPSKKKTKAEIEELARLDAIAHARMTAIVHATLKGFHEARLMHEAALDTENVVEFRKGETA